MISATHRSGHSCPVRPEGAGEDLSPLNVSSKSSNSAPLVRVSPDAQEMSMSNVSRQMMILVILFISHIAS